MSPEQITYIQTHYNRDKSAAEVAAHLGLSELSMRQYMSRLRSKGIWIPHRVLDHKRVAVILCNYGRMSTEALAGMLDMEYAALRAYVQYLRDDAGIAIPNAYHKCAHNKKEASFAIARSNPSSHKAAGEKPAKTKPERAKRVNVKIVAPKTGRPAVNHMENPEVIHIRQPKEEGRFVPVYGKVKTWKWMPLSQLEKTGSHG
jgi:biotin operon repressor